MASENTTDPTPLFERARRELETDIFYQEHPDWREDMIQERARAFAIYAAPVGLAAARIGAALDALREEIDSFFMTFKDDDGAAAAVREAIESAGLNPDAGNRGYKPNHFDCTVYELNTWRPVLEVMYERLDDIENPFPLTPEVPPEGT